MNEYRVTYVTDEGERTVELKAETVREIGALLPADADIVTVRLLRALTFSCRTRGTLR